MTALLKGPRPAVAVTLIIALTSMGCAGRLPENGPRIRVALETSPPEVIEVPLERYIRGVVAGEIPADWPLEALKAQAVVSRTYAIYKKQQAEQKGSPYDLEDSTKDQVFLADAPESERFDRAVIETKGEILTFGGETIPAFFHSTCGGLSEKASAVWEGEFPPPLETIHQDPFCEESPRSHWDYTASQEEAGGELQVLERGETGRIGTLLISTTSQDEEISGNRFRERIGFEKIRSTLFDIETQGNQLHFTGRGAGHGVGLCQWGAKGMAELGYTYREILEFYYPGAVISTYE